MPFLAAAAPAIMTAVSVVSGVVSAGVQLYSQIKNLSASEKLNTAQTAKSITTDDTITDEQQEETIYNMLLQKGVEETKARELAKILMKASGEEVDQIMEGIRNNQLEQNDTTISGNVSNNNLAYS